VGLRFGRSSALFAHMRFKQLLISKEEIDFLDHDDSSGRTHR
jgi:hypothetical protein